MKLKKLDITNIASISKASIDFTSAPLADSPIFLICGETGSGKSTILDAICLALYNKTPRLSNGNRTTENTYLEGSQKISIVAVNQLLKKGEKEGSISLLFEGADGTDYLAEWKCNVNRNKKLENETWTITDSTGHTDSGKGKARDTKMAEIIGLDYDEFCRTSMLAQGQFTQFLKADTKDKSDILEKITGTEIYARIGSRIHQKAKEANDAFKAAEKEVKAIEILPEEDKEAKKKEISGIDAKIAADKALEKLLDTLVKAFDDIDTANGIIKKSEEALEYAKTSFAILTGDIAWKKADMKQKQERAGQLEKSISSRKEREEMYANMQTIESCLENVTKQRGICKSQQETLEKENKDLETMSAEAAAILVRKTGAEDTLNQKNKAVTDATEAKTALGPDEVEKERKAVAERLGLIGKATADYATIRSKKDNLSTARKDYAKVEETLKTDRETVKTGEEKAAAADKAYKEVQATYDRQAQVLDAAAVSLREWLRETGVHECPVCHAKITSLTTTEQEENNLKPLKELLDKKKQEKDAAASELTAARTALATKETDHSKALNRITAAEKELVNLNTGFAQKYSPLGITGKEDNPEAALEYAKASLDSRKTANEAAIKAINGKQQAIDAATAERDRFRKEVYEPAMKEYADVSEIIKGINSRIQTAGSLLEAAKNAGKESLAKASGLISVPAWQEAWEADAAGFITTLKDEAEAYFKDVDEAEKTKREIATSKKETEDATTVHDRIQASDAGIAPETVTPAAYEGNAILEWGRLESKVNSARENMRTSRAHIAESKETIGKAFGADPSLPQTKEEILERKAAVSNEAIEQSSRRGALQNIIDEDDRKRKELGDKIALCTEASEAYARWNTLDGLFGGPDGFTFKKIAQGYIMQDILGHANSYLRRIAPRYELTAQPGALVILVKDTEEGAVRSGNTLSGGEGFVISLSLALGLSSIAENSISVDTIFIDEGFGTLSQEWLNSVMAALEKLNSSSGKHVGIISHIEDLQKRIPTVIEVKKKNATTSEITVRG